MTLRITTPPCKCRFPIPAGLSVTLKGGACSLEAMEPCRPEVCPPPPTHSGGVVSWGGGRRGDEWPEAQRGQGSFAL